MARGEASYSPGVRTDPRELADQTFDLLVVGGGIHGAAVARDAALRGATVLLVEAHDFAAGTSSRSSRLVHGGLRYLRQGAFGLVREALHERERLLRLCPHLVRPVPMVMPFFQDGPGSRWLTRLGVQVYGWIGGRSTLPGPQGLAPKDALAAFPGLRARGLRGAVRFFDAATQDARLTLANVLAARQAGARVVNHCAAVGHAAAGTLLRDGRTGAEVTVRARHVVNAAGPRADAVRRAFDCQGPDLVRTSRGSHLVLPERPGETALCAFLPDQRIQFVIPHRDGTLCGTTEVDEAPGNAEPTVPEADRQYLLDALGWLLDPAPTPADVRFGYSGWRSLPTGAGPPGALHREAFVVREPLSDATLHTIVGGKLTTHRSFAEKVVGEVLGLHVPSPTRDLPLPGGDGPREVGDPLWWRHGSRTPAVRALAGGDAALLQPVCPHRPFLGCEVLDAVQELGAVTLTDLALRRLMHSQGPCLQSDCLRALHALHCRAGGADSGLEHDLAALQAEVQHLAGAALPVPATAEGSR